MRRRCIAACIAALLTLAWASAARAQASAFLPLDHPAYRYIDALQARGALRALPALDRPYRIASIRAALDDSASLLVSPYRDWMHALQSAIAVLDPSAPGSRCVDAVRMHEACATIVGGLFATAQRSGLRDPMRADTGGGGVHPGASLRFSLSADNIVAVTRILGDRRLKFDPEYTGKRDRGATGRVEDAYLSAQWRHAELFAGRLARNWGPPGIDGVLLGAYAYTFDHVYARVGGERLAAMTMLARLDDRVVNADTVAQRYLAMHRVRARWRALEIALSEAVVYGGPSRGLDPAFSNPFNVYVGSQFNENSQGNLTASVEASLRTARLGAWSTQLMLDDVQIDDCGANCEEPPSYGLTLNADGLPLGGLFSGGIRYTRISALAYRSPNSWEQHAVHEVGIGRGFSDYDELRVAVALPPLAGSVLRVAATHQRQGSGDYRLPYPPASEYATTPAFLIGRVCTLRRLSLDGVGGVAGVSIAGDVGMNRGDSGCGAYRSGTNLEGRVTVRVEKSLWSFVP